jgi:hypothetical protein
MPDVRFGSKADILRCGSDVRFTPQSGHAQCTSRCPLSANSGHGARSFDHLVGAVEQPARHREAERLSGFKINH